MLYNIPIQDICPGRRSWKESCSLSLHMKSDQVIM